MTYLLQLCTDTGCSLNDLRRAMADITNSFYHPYQHNLILYIYIYIYIYIYMRERMKYSEFVFFI